MTTHETDMTLQETQKFFVCRFQTKENPEAAKIVNLHFPLIYIFARIYIPNLRKLKGKCKFYIFPKNVFFRRKIEDLCKNENFHFFCTLKIITLFPYPWSAPWTFEVCWQSLYPGPYSLL